MAPPAKQVSPRGKNPPPTSNSVSIAIALAFVGGCAFFCFLAASAGGLSRLGVVLLVVLLLPFPISLSLLMSRDPRFIGLGTGVACGYLGGLLTFSPLALFLMFLAVGFGGLDGKVLAASVTLLVFVGSGARAVWSAWQLSGSYRDGFRYGVGAAGLYLFLLFCFMARIQAKSRF